MDLNFNNALTIASLLAGGVATIMAIPAFCLLLLTVAAGKRNPTRPGSQAVGRAIRVAILVPAHNESQHILPTLRCLQMQVQAGDRLLVIADNCNDDTAKLARECGAEVIERQNDSLRGKGYALAFGVDALRNCPPEVLIVVDADCTVSEGGIHALAQRCVQTNCPVQMLDLMVAPKNANLRTRMLEFAWLVKNKVRPIGSFRMGRACHLMGTGMALPWDLAASACLATGHITEDMKLGVDMAIAGRPAQFLVEAQITSEFPLEAAVARAQKTRWEHGHLQTLVEELPRLLAAFARRPRIATLVLAMDLVIPPLALYAICVTSSLAVWALGSHANSTFLPALWITIATATVLFAAITLAWYNHARQLLTTRELLTIPLYMAWKLPVYIAYLLRRKSTWIKTARKV